MKKFYILALALMALTACTSDEHFVDVQEPEQDNGKIVVTMQQPEISGMPESRSSLHYNKFDGNKMIFAWDKNDMLGVFPYNVTEHLQQVKFYQSEASDPDNPTFLIKKDDDQDQAVTLNSNSPYVAYFPFIPNHKSYDIPVTYRDQKQAGMVDMRHYFDSPIAGDDKNTYAASERAAAAHLNKYDYLCSAPTVSRIFGGITLNMKRMGSIVRFYIKAPATNMVYTELQLFNSEADFILDGTINVNTILDDKIEDASQKRIFPRNNGTSHMMKLDFEITENGKKTGVDMSLAGDGKTPVHLEYFDYYKEKYTPYIIAYMMLAPIDLSTINNCNLYLIGHEPTDENAIHYYKATLGNKPKLTPNIFYQWSVAKGDEPEQPIEFVETTIEDWRQATGVDNGTGTGTSGW